MNLLIRAVFIFIAAFALHAADAPKSFKVGEFTFNRPDSWLWVESTSPMRKAEMKISDPKSAQKADVAFFHFGPSGGGGTKANIERWFGQFQESRDKINARTEDVTVGKHKITYVQAEGTYKSGMPGGPQTPMSEHALMGAIIESEEGNVFVRMTGPKALVKASGADFKKMVESHLH